MPLVPFNLLTGPYQVLPCGPRADLGAMTMKGCSSFPKTQHHWNLTVRLFSVIYRTLIVRVYPSAEVHSTDSAH